MKEGHVGILTGPDTHLDHLGVLCHLLDIPLIITEEETYRSCLTFYPQVQASFKELRELSPSFLLENFTAVFQSAKFWTAELRPILHFLYQKDLRFIFCPHGNSDKGHSLKNHVEQDISLVYGDHMIDLLRRTGAIEKIGETLKTGNYRLPFYKKNQAFYDDLLAKKIPLDKTKKTILYAPTWQDQENPSSFFTETQKLIEELGEEFNLIIKLHPLLMKFHPAETFRVLSLYENSPKVHFLDAFPPIYPILNASDLYIGDYSSIGYDFLSFDKPLYFVADPSDQSPLSSCGLRIPENANARKFIQNTFEENLRKKQEIRKKVYLYAFGEERSFKLIKNELKKILLRE
jgi:hypothetical protein